MRTYEFQETLSYFAQKLHVEPPPATDIESGVAELIVEDVRVFLSKPGPELGVEISITIAALKTPISEELLKELCTSNFLGINTLGCSFSLDATGSILRLHAQISASTPPEQGWEWLERLVFAASKWKERASSWPVVYPVTAGGVA